MNIDDNWIGDAGFYAIVKVLLSVHDDSTPVLMHLGMRGNRVSGAVKAEFFPLPNYLAV